MNCKSPLCCANSPLTLYYRSKYPISILSRLLDTLGNDVAVAYDIGCRFRVTAGNSPLSARLTQQRWSFFVNAFHGWSHNRLCQLKNHPLFKVGYGLEDFETCERFFSFLNLTARPLRHSSQFHRRQFLELYMEVNDHDRYQNLGKSIFYYSSPSSNVHCQVNSFETTGFKPPLSLIQMRHAYRPLNVAHQPPGYLKFLEQTSHITCKMSGNTCMASRMSHQKMPLQLSMFKR